MGVCVVCVDMGVWVYGCIGAYTLHGLALQMLYLRVFVYCNGPTSSSAVHGCMGVCVCVCVRVCVCMCMCVLGFVYV